MDDHTTCLVIGGGPAGMVLGLLLARAGVEVTVAEKHGDFLRDFRGDTVHPSTTELLDELGLGEKFAALPQSQVQQVAFPGEDGQNLIIGDFSRLKIAHPYVAMVPQWDLLNLLAKAGRDEPTFTLRMNTEIIDLLEQSGKITGARYRAKDGQEGELTADLTIACDGRWSITHQLQEFRPKEFPVPVDAWWFRLPRKSSDRTGALQPAMRRGEFAVVIPRQDYFQIAYLATKGIDAEIRAAGLESFRTRIAHCLPWLADRVSSLTTLDDVKHLDVRLNVLPRWYGKGLLCIGDAAHAMSPVGGVGINLAVQDAVAAARLLAKPLSQGAVTERDLAHVQTRRRLPTFLVQTLQRVLHAAVIRPVIQGRRSGPPRVAVSVFRRFPRLSYLPAYLIGVGFNRERAPEFARRAPESAPKN
jgi:2-polyprenyl-6-methoxyphenol hydroxylase-like FAD-dependent oxidoreductase